MKFFKIESIENGWFEMRFGSDNYITSSKYLGCDTPKLMLSALTRIIDNSSEDEWLCCHDEPNAVILHFYSGGDTIFLKVHTAVGDAFALPFFGSALENETDECIYAHKFDIKRFIDDVITEFSLYEGGNGLKIYDVNWLDFPQKEFDDLKKSSLSL